MNLHPYDTVRHNSDPCIKVCETLNTFDQVSSPTPGHNAPPPGLPCHTCGPLSLSYVEHLNHRQSPIINENFTCFVINKKFPCFVTNKYFPCSAIS